MFLITIFTFTKIEIHDGVGFQKVVIFADLDLN